MESKLTNNIKNDKNKYEGNDTMTSEIDPTRDITPKDVANFFVALDDAYDHEDGITNLKLQKLAYYAQGYHIALFDKPLFQDDIEAWQYGPVVPSLYRELAHSGRNPVEVKSDDVDISMSKFNKKQKALLTEIFKKLGQYSAWKLMEMTHSESPWRETTTGKGSVIPKELLGKYFKTMVA